MGFPFWFSQTEQAIRYHDVKANDFAGEPAIAARLLSRRNIYRAYLLENILPGAAGAAVKSTPRLLATEGVVAALFARWMRDPVLRQPVKSEAFYERFDTNSSQVTSIEHAYLKLFAAMAERRTHDAASLVRSYAEMFPDEVAAVAGVVRDAGLTWPLPDAPEIWLANDRFMTGTSLFDQFRAAPRVHTFDLNAASLVDLLTVDGVTPDLARAIQQGAPYALVSDAGVVPGVTAAVVDRLSHMHDEMTRLREANAGADDESMNLMQILTPLLIRASVWILIGAAVAAWLYGRVRLIRPLRLAVNGFAAASLGLLAAWTLGAALQYGSGGIEPAILAFLPVLVFAVPGALWQLARGNSGGDAARVVAAWTVACVPAVAITQPLF
jgi:DNA uptake protein ComE-like DNA-binding protein